MRPATFVGVMLLCAGCAESQRKSILPCDKYDHAAQADLAKNAARSKLERDACAGERSCIDQVLAKRDAYVFKRCALPESAQ